MITSDAFASVLVALFDEILTLLSSAEELSNVQLNWLAAVFPLPAASVNAPAPTSMEVAPAELGVKVAVYTDELDAAKLLNEPPETVTSPTTKFVVASFEVNVKAIDSSLLVSPSDTVELAIETVGATVSIVKSAIVTDPALPEASVTVTVFPL